MLKISKLFFRLKVKGILTRCWIRTREIRFKNRLKTIQDSILTENISKKLNSNSLEGHQILKLTTGSQTLGN
ncbi:hypothetical protein A3I53_01135 [Candidatus Curtissbacteria bacterium RIFCSPLOWO2_02_FULL_40_13b]|uniref:Uncharacterized protein n=1 Tax=Candidatus Curtissbacteria bacterium RIFCSPLOWO2_02_FULL_40_13b TaxID=1797733 RepID=A0A1F5HW93_9BACT|nr:MAG: hypothetical protein A3I53_01135 [Candidatus Curtissbacteria bacterium RIFCSPLOWO2_02_FULL_40_13b]